MTQDLPAARKLLSDGRPEQARTLLHSITRKDPENIEALFFCGQACLQLGDGAGACAQFEKALRIDPHNAALGNALGVTLFQLNEIDRSEAILRQTVGDNPENYEAIGNLGLVLAHTGKHGEALEMLQRAARNGAATTRILEELGKELIHDNQPAKARQVFTRLKQRQPDNPVANTYLGRFLAALGEVEEARLLWEHVKTSHPDDTGPYVSEAIEHLKKGDEQTAIRCLETALTIKSGQADAAFLWAHTVNSDTQTNKSREGLLADIKQRLDQGGLCYDDSNNLMFAAGRLSAAQNDYDASFDYYHRANKRIWSRQSITPNTFEKRTDALLDVFNPIFFLKHKGIVERRPKGDDKCGEGLIFIFGMPRSGTTLVEQIISRNPAVHTGGECGHMAALAETVGEITGETTTFPLSVRGLSLEGARRLAGNHHATINSATGNAAFFTDKSLENYMTLGLMALLFPKAAFIHCTRHPVDTCLSAYTAYFAHNSLKYTYDLDTLGRTYVQYQRIMKAWHTTLPTRIHDVVYEDMTAEPEKVIRDLVACCGFEWRDDYLSPQSAKAAVATASVAQVRKPINKKSVGRWKPYQAHLGPLLKALGMAGEYS